MPPNHPPGDLPLDPAGGPPFPRPFVPHLQILAAPLSQSAMKRSLQSFSVSMLTDASYSLLVNISDHVLAKLFALFSADDTIRYEMLF